MLAVKRSPRRLGGPLLVLLFLTLSGVLANSISSAWAFDMSGHYDYYSTSVTWNFDDNTAQGFACTPSMTVTSAQHYSGNYSIYSSDITGGANALVCWNSLFAAPGTMYIPHIAYSFPAGVTNANISYYYKISNIASLDANSLGEGLRVLNSVHNVSLYSHLNTGLSLASAWRKSEVFNITSAIIANTSYVLAVGYVASWGGTNWGKWDEFHFDDIVLKYSYRTWIPGTGLPLGNMRSALAVCAFFGLIIGPAYSVYQIKEHEFVKAVLWGPVIFFTCVALMMGVL